MFAALDAIKLFMKVNRDIFIRTLFLTFVFAFFHSKSSVQDDMTLAANIILLQFLNWMSFGLTDLLMLQKVLLVNTMELRIGQKPILRSNTVFIGVL